jgi:ABC transport system ATP-binding/permease protein
MILVNAQNLGRTFGSHFLFENISLAVNEEDRIALIGPNGAGKSTLLQMLAGLQQPDAGICSIKRQTRLSYVPQDSVFEPGRSVFDSALEAADEHDDAREVLASNLLSQAGFTDFQAEAARLSGGWRKRLAIVRGLAARPDLLFLDEPTNHLDIEGIEWLENILATARFAVLLVSHDRYFLDNVATRVAELNRVYPEGLFIADGNYSQFLEKRADYMAARAQYQESLANQVRREVEWLRRGPKARTTKSKARIDNAERMIAELGDLQSRSRQSIAGLDFTASGRKTKRLIETTGVTKSLGGKLLFDKLDLKLFPGMRIGLAGGNGTGKTTLLRILQGLLPPDAGTVELADKIRIVYFDQNRDSLDPAQTLRRALAPEGDSVIFRDRPQHVAGWAKRFLFRADQLDMPVGRLSGGEKARLLIARLMLMPADVLLLDEPTNDLDIPTLEVLEENLVDFPGAMMLVTHDRFLLDRVSTAVLGLHGDGTSQLYADFYQWEEAMEEKAKASIAAAREKAAPVVAAVTTASPQKKKLSYNEAREWETIETRIHEAERRLEELKALLESPDVVSNGPRLQQVCADIETSQTAVDQLYERWSELEAKIS